MVKHGILHDYDLMANREESATENTCVVCEASPVSYQWSDYSGEAMCTRCGTPYQLKWGTDEQKEEGDYPYLSLAEKWVEVVREYWNEHGEFVCLGTMFSDHRPGLRRFDAWAREHYPHLYEEPAP